mgnify:CR=1 FL=1
MLRGASAVTITARLHEVFAGDGGEPTPLERATLRFYLTGMVFQGLWWAGYLLIPFVLAKSLRAPTALITLSVMMDNLGMFLALYWGHLLATRGGLRRYLLWAGILGRLVLLGVVFVRSAGQMVGLLAVVYVFAAMIYPAQNTILENNFRPEVRGRWFGIGALVQNSVAVVASLAIGWLLDLDAELFRAVYASLGICGFLYLWLLARAPTPAGTPPRLESGAVGLAAVVPLPPAAVGPFTPGRVLRGLARPFTDALRIFRTDRAFNWFEINFMTYGAAFMCLSPVVPIFLTDRLALSYGEISTARVMIGQIGVALLGPLMGRANDRYHPVRLCAVAFALFALYPVMLDLAGALPVAAPVRLVYVAFAVYSVGMAGINVVWNVGSIAFAPPGRGGYYQGIHVAMVGIRGTLGPLLGWAVYEWVGLRAVFALAALLLLAAALSSAALWRDMAGAERGRHPGER